MAQIMQNTTPLSHPVPARDGMRLVTLRTIGDAASFITSLPMNHDALHWKHAAVSIEQAASNPTAELISHATKALENALTTDDIQG
jgi:hypothetical protein